LPNRNELFYFIHQDDFKKHSGKKKKKNTQGQIETFVKPPGQNNKYLDIIKNLRSGFKIIIKIFFFKEILQFIQ